MHSMFNEAYGARPHLNLQTNRHIFQTCRAVKYHEYIPDDDCQYINYNATQRARIAIEWRSNQSHLALEFAQSEPDAPCP